MASDSYPSPRDWVDHVGVFGAVDGDRIEQGILSAHERLDTVSSATAGSLPLFNVEDYGAVGDGAVNSSTGAITGTDDYTAVKAAWDAMLASSTGGLLYFPRAVQYRVNLETAGRVTTNSAGSYAAFRLPDVTPGNSTPKKTFGILGVGSPYTTRQNPVGEGDGIAGMMQVSAVLLVDYSTPFTWSASTGLPSVFAAPDADKGAAIGNAFEFINVHFVADKITIRQPDNPSLCGINVETCSTAIMGEVGFDVTKPLDLISEPTHPTGCALLMPRVMNNVVALIDKMVAVGHYAGIPHTEHLDLRSGTVMRCKIAVPFRRHAYHAAHISMITIEQCPWGFAGYNPAGVGPNLGIVAIPADGVTILKGDFVNFEDNSYDDAFPWMYAPGAGAHVWDPNNVLRGQIVAARNDVDASGMTDSIWVGGATSFSIFGLINWDVDGVTRNDATAHAPANP